MGVVDDTSAKQVLCREVEHGIGQGGIGDDIVPAVDQHLQGDQQRAAAIAVLDVFEQVVGQIIKRMAGRGRFRPPVVNDEKMRQPR